MKILYSKIFNKSAKDKYPKSETEPYNPWAVCNQSTGGKNEEPEKFERCVNHLKDQNKEKNKKVDKFKDTRRTVDYRTNPSLEEELGDVFQEKMDEDISGKRKEKKDRKLDDVWLNTLGKIRSKKKNEEMSVAFVIESKKK